METIEKAYTIKNRTGILATAGVLLPQNSERRGLIIQNLSTNHLYIKFGVDASDSSFDVVLKAGDVLDNGSGGILSFDVLSYTGVITVAGTLVRCTATEF